MTSSLAGFAAYHHTDRADTADTADRADTMDGEELRAHASGQFRRMYRYGLALLLAGALCNWIGFAQNTFAPIRYLGVGCVLAGVFCICLALCRWLALSRLSSNCPASSETVVATSTSATVHVITVPIQQQNDVNMSKPPDYESIVGSLPPSYEEAVQISPANLLQQQQQQHLDLAAVRERPPPYCDGNQSQPVVAACNGTNGFFTLILSRFR